MGYRHYIATIDKTLYQQIRNLTKKELADFFKSLDKNVNRREFVKEVYEMGKYVEADYLKEHSRQFFDKKETNLNYHNEDTELYLITRAGFDAIIESYHKIISDNFAKLLEHHKNGTKDMWGEDPVAKYLIGKGATWENSKNYQPYSLTGEPITHSWSYEYAIFELVRIYKSINWENQLVVITGH